MRRADEFYDVRFPTHVSFGSSGGPERRTEIVTLTNGFEERNSPWADSRRRYDAGIGIRSLDDLAEVVAFFEARRGQLHGFRWKDWSDFKSCKPSGSVSDTDQVLGTGDGATTEFLITKAYASGEGEYDRAISKPVLGSVQVAVDGIAESGVAVDHTTGIVTFATAPAMGAALTVGFEFDVPVRFDTDRIETSVAGFEIGEIPGIPVIEVRV